MNTTLVENPIIPPPRAAVKRKESAHRVRARCEDPPLLTALDVALRLRVSERSVWRWSAQGLLPPPVRLGRKTTRWRAADIAGLLGS